jgi:pimeloyl-ACP methyl ester carboxylesterase
MDDPVVDINWSDYISDWYYNYTFRPLPGVGHFAMREATDILNQEIRDFFKS